MRPARALPYGVAATAPARSAVLVIAATALLAAALYLVAMHLLAPAIADGGVPVLSAMAQARGYSADVFFDLTERLFVPFGIALAAAAAVLARRRGWFPTADAERFWVVAIALLTAVLATVFTLNALHGPVQFRGDANDYLLMNVSLANHLTPDLRPADIAEYGELRFAADLGAQSPYDGYFQSPRNGNWYCWHFWLYPAFAVPGHWALDAVGLSPLKVYELSNIAMFLLAMHAIARIARLRPHQRALFAGLFVMSPIAWYMSWPSAEVFTASLVVLAIALFTRERYVPGVLAAGLGATMNPSLLVVVAALAAYGVLKTPRPGRLSSAIRLAAAASLSLLAATFNFIYFGAGNLIQRAGMASTGFISAHKIEAFFLSLNQGLLPYVPVVLVLATVAVGRAIVRRDAWTLVRFLAVLAAVTLSATTIEWNSDAAGMRRHAMWVFPLLLWLALELLASDTPKVRRAAALALAAQYLVFAAWVYPPGMSQLSPLAELVLTHAPGLYSPVPTDFAPRAEHYTVPIAEALPAVFVADGSVSKVLVDDVHLESLGRYLLLTPDALARLDHPRATEQGLSYLEFAPGQATLRVQDDPVEARDFPIEVTLGGPSRFGGEFDIFNRFGTSAEGLPEAAPYTWYAVHVRLENTGGSPWYPQGPAPLYVVVTVTAEATGEVTEIAPVPLVRAVMPGEEVAVYAHFITPKETGTVRVSARFVQTAADGAETLLAGPAGDHRISVVMAPAAP
jgi:hypothetical protein